MIRGPRGACQLPALSALPMRHLMLGSGVSQSAQPWVEQPTHGGWLTASSTSNPAFARSVPTSADRVVHAGDGPQPTAWAPHDRRCCDRAPTGVAPFSCSAGEHSAHSLHSQVLRQEGARIWEVGVVP